MNNTHEDFFEPIDEKDIPKNFIEAMKDLLIFSEEVYKYDVEGKVKLDGTTNVCLSNLIKYKNFYLGTDRSPKGTRDDPTHFNQMCSIYKKCCPKILNSEKASDFQDWLLDQKFFIKINVDTPKRKLSFSFLITSIYQHTIHMADFLSDEREKSSESEGSKIELYPDMFCFYFLRVLLFCTDSESEKEQIYILLQELEDILKPAEGGSLDYKEPLADMFSMADEVATELGIPITKGHKKSINMKEFKHNIKSLIKQPGTKNAMKKMLEGLDMNNPDPKNLGTFFTRIAQNFQETANMEPSGLSEAKKAKAEN